MGYTIFSLTGRANPNILAERLYRQQWRKANFGLWVAPEFIKATRDTADPVLPGVDEGGVKFSGAPIEVFKQFLTQGKTTLDIPVRLRLTGLPVFGDKVLKGSEESGKIAYRTVMINLTRKAYSRPSLMSAQVTLPYLENLMLAANEYLTQWFNDYHPGNFLCALSCGASVDLLNGVTAGGRGKAIVSHPNMYICGGVKVTYGAGRPGTAGYETSVETAVDAANSSTTNALTVAKVQGLMLEAQRLRIQPLLMKAGFRRFAMWISDAQWLQLSNDTFFKDWYRRLPTELDSHPLATGARADISGCIIYVDQTMPHVSTHANYEAGFNQTTSGYPSYFPEPIAAEKALGYNVGNMIERRCTLPRKVGFIIGESALSVGVGVPVSGGKKGASMQFVEQFDDYGAIAGIGVATVQSVLRSDVYDQDGMVDGLSAGDFYENTSSLAFVSNSPDTLTS